MVQYILRWGGGLPIPTVRVQGRRSIFLNEGAGDEWQVAIRHGSGGQGELLTILISTPLNYKKYLFECQGRLDPPQPPACLECGIVPL